MARIDKSSRHLRASVLAKTLETCQSADAERGGTNSVDTIAAGAVFVRRTARGDTSPSRAREVRRALGARQRLTMASAVAPVRRRAVRIGRTRRPAHDIVLSLLKRRLEGIGAATHPSLGTLRILGTSRRLDTHWASSIAHSARHARVSIADCSSAAIAVLGTRLSSGWDGATPRAVVGVGIEASPPHV